MASLPMFPLGGVLVPGAVLPLHVFEPRYRTLMADCLDGDGTFGVVLIERGSEVGGGDQRADVGTTASIEQYQRLEDGRFALIAVGRERFRVSEWLGDEPYPRARIQHWADPPLDAVDQPLLVRARQALDVVLATGEPLPEVSPDPSLASHQLTAVAPLGPYDRYRLLCAAGPADRLRLLIALLDDLPEPPAAPGGDI
jgi:hypothetical protein